MGAASRYNIRVQYVCDATLCRRVLHTVLYSAPEKYTHSEYNQPRTRAPSRLTPFAWSAVFSVSLSRAARVRKQFRHSVATIEMRAFRDHPEQRYVQLVVCIMNKVERPVAASWRARQFLFFFWRGVYTVYMHENVQRDLV